MLFHFSELKKGIPFSAGLMTILLSHELGHYFTARYYGCPVSPPLFIPMPPPFLFGTMGAIIRLRSLPDQRGELLDIGASGPLIGFFFSLIALITGLLLSKSALPPPMGASVIEFHSSLLIFFIEGAFQSRIPVGEILEWHPLALAGWVGLYVTALNLIPLGQLDGGHILYGLFGKNTNVVMKVLWVILAALGVFVFEGWLVWAILILLFGLRHPRVILEGVPLSLRQKIIGIISMILLIITFVPIPLSFHAME